MVNQTDKYATQNNMYVHIFTTVFAGVKYAQLYVNHKEYFSIKMPSTNEQFSTTGTVRMQEGSLIINPMFTFSFILSGGIYS